MRLFTKVLLACCDACLILNGFIYHEFDYESVTMCILLLFTSVMQLHPLNGLDLISGAS